MLDTIYSQVAAAVMVMVCGFALWKGEKTEHAGAAIYFLAWVLSLIVQDRIGYEGPQWVLMAVDVLVLAGFAELAWRSRRSWPIWAAAFQSIVLAIHVLSLAGLATNSLAFFAAQNLSAYGVLGSLAAGTWRAWRERDALQF